MTDMPLHLGILAGLKSETRTLTNANKAGALIEISGARPTLAEAGAKRLIAAGCTHLISYGIAGALAPGLKAGQLLLPEAVTGISGDRFPVDKIWHRAAAGLLETLNPMTGLIAWSDEAVSSVEGKAMLRSRTAALAVDMESHWIAAAARAAGIPFLVIRAIADEADQILPPAALVGVTPSGDTNLIAVLASVVRYPAQIPALIRLGRAASAAHQTLQRCDLLGGSLGFGAVGFDP